MQEELLKRLDLLAAKLGVTLDQLWRVLVRQAQVEIWINLLQAAVLCSVLVITYQIFFRIWQKLPEARKGSSVFAGDGCVMIMILCSIVFVGSTIWAIVDLSELPTLILNPQFWALRELGALLH